MRKAYFANKQRRMLVTGVLSAIIYGAWALYVNYGQPTALASSITQAICSFFGGYLVASIVELVFGMSKKPWRFPVSAFGPYAVTLSVYALVHSWVGTPEIFKTILPNVIIGTPYFFLYCIRLEREDTAIQSQYESELA